MKNKILYVLILAVSLALAVFGTQKFWVFLVGFELIFLAGEGLLSFYLAQRITVSLTLPVSVVSKSEPFPAGVQVTNPSRLPVAAMAAQVTWLDCFDGTQVTEQISGMADGGSAVRLQLNMMSRYAGKLAFCLERVKVYDYLKLFGWSVPLPQKEDWQQVLVTPLLHEIPLRIGDLSQRYFFEGDSHSHTRSGDDVSEVFDIRAFRAGDTMQKVHWKLTAKTDELLVKEFSLPTENWVLLLVDLHLEKKEGWNHAKLDRLLELTASLSYSLLLAGLRHEVAWYDEGKGQLVRAGITGEADILEMTGKLAEAGVSDRQYALDELYAESASLEHCSRLLRVDADCGIWVGGICAASLAGKDLNTELPQLTLYL